MPYYDDALRGYAAEILERDHFKCRYCGADGTKSFDIWLSLLGSFANERPPQPRQPGFHCHRVQLL